MIVDGDEVDENRQPSRRTFLTGAAGLTGVALAVGAWKPVLAMEDASISAAAAGRNFGPVHIALTLGESSAAGFLSHAEGGNAFGDVVNEKLGPDGVTRKHLAGVKYEDITINCGTGMSKAFYDWVSSSFGSKDVRMSGAIDATDFNFKIRSEMTFSNAMITEVGFPALDAASKDAAKMTVKFAPEFTRVSAKTGTLKAPTNLKTAKWLASNFKLSLDGVDTSRVTHIDAFALTFDVITNSDGNAVGRNLNVPNMKVRIPAASAGDFIKWHQDFVIDGNNGQEQEKTGSISYLAPDLTTEIFRLDIGNVGIFALDYDPLDVSTDSLRQVTVQLYAETMKFFNRQGSPA